MPTKIMEFPMTEQIPKGVGSNVLANETTASAKLKKNNHNHTTQVIDIKNLNISGLEKPLKIYGPRCVPKGVNLYKCTSCEDKFAIKSSLEYHINRRTILITYYCEACAQHMVFYNRCMFVKHLQTHTNNSNYLFQTDISNVCVSAIPAHILEKGMGLSYDPNAEEVAVKTNPKYVLVDKTIVKKIKLVNNKNIQKRSNGLSEDIVVSENDSAKSNVVNDSEGNKKNQTVKILPSITQSSESVLKLMNKSITDATNEPTPLMLNDFQSSKILSSHTIIMTENGLMAMPRHLMNNVPEHMQQETIRNYILGANETLTLNIKTPSADDSNKGTSTSYSEYILPDTELANPEAPAENVEPPTNRLVLKNIDSLLDKKDTNLVKQNLDALQPQSILRNVQCKECYLVLQDQQTLKGHLLGQYQVQPDNKSPDCSTCGLVLPTFCALSCHQRIHDGNEPHICPDCAIEFNTHNDLKVHIETVCFHLHKCASYHCPMPGCMKTYFTKRLFLIDHLNEMHTKTIFKCSDCPIACLTKPTLLAHIAKDHPESTQVALPYMQCSFCPDRLIPKSRLDSHMFCHSGNEMVYIYKCQMCKAVNKSLQVHRHHRCRLANDSNLVRRTCVDCKCNIILKINGNQSVVLPVRCPACSKHPVSFKNKNVGNMQDHIQNKLPRLPPLKNRVKETMQLKTYAKTGQPTVIKCKDQDDLKEKSILKRKVPSKKSLACDSKVTPVKSHRLVRCKVCTKQLFVKREEMVNHYKEFHPTYKCTKLGDLKILGKEQLLTNQLNNISIDSSNICSDSNPSIVKNEMKVLDSTICDFNSLGATNAEMSDESISDISPVSKAKRKKRTFNPRKKAEDVVNPFSGGLNLSPPNISTLGHKCAKCQYETKTKSDFRDHILTHRDVSTAYQCMECGLCYMVQPSLEKHLLIDHSITDIKGYLAANECVDLDAVKAVLTSNIVGPTVDEPLEENQCRICKEIFSNAADHDKHFRVHGLAFLKMQQLNKLNAEA